MSEFRQPRSARRRLSPEAGFSIIEGLVSMAVLLIVVVGLIPLFTQSMVNNVAGRQMTQATNFAADGFEEVAQIDFEDQRLIPAAGNNSLRISELFASGQLIGSPVESLRQDIAETTAEELDYQAVIAAFDPDDVAQAEYLRVITVRQFPLSASRDGQLTVDEQLDGDFPANAVNLKLIEITVVSVNDGSIVGQGRTTASVVKVI